MRVAFAIVLFYAAANVRSQIFPYISFKGRTLSNHSYVDVSLVGSSGDGSDSVQCHTDLDSCCSRFQGPHRGDWHFPNGTRLGFRRRSDIYASTAAQRVDLRRENNAIANGIYYCSVYVNPGRFRETVYVGLYANGGIRKLLCMYSC